MHAMRQLKNAIALLYAFSTLIAVNFIFNVHHAGVAYVNSSFLGQFFSPEWVSVIYVIQSLVVLCALLAAPYLIGIFGPRGLLILLIPVAQIAVLFLGLSQDPVSAVFFFILQGIAIWILFYLLDLYVEGATKKEEQTGGIRASFLTAGNIAIFFGPIMIALFVIGDYYAPLYAVSAALLIPAFALALTSFSKLESAAPKKNAFIAALKTLRCCRPGVGYAIAAQFLLRVFYSWIVVYIPLYLIYEAALSWQAVGTLTALALFAFILLEVPLGILADRYFGEKEIMIIGFAILGISTALLSLIPIAALVLWGIAFFFTRVGAAMVEITTEAHFFKKVNETDSALISVFRVMNPLGFVVGPLVAVILLPFTGLQFIFGFFGAILLIGIPIALRIVDTK